MIKDRRSICFLFWKEVLLGIAGATRKGVDTQDASMLLCTGLGRRLMIARDLQLSCRMYTREKDSTSTRRENLSPGKGWRPSLNLVHKADRKLLSNN